MKQNIHCDVTACRHQDGASNCSLSGIQVSNTCSDVLDKKDTGCMSFECE